MEDLDFYIGDEAMEQKTPYAVKVSLIMGCTTIKKFYIKLMRKMVYEKLTCPETHFLLPNVIPYVENTHIFVMPK